MNMNLPARIAAAAALYDPTLLNELRAATLDRDRRWRNPLGGEGGAAPLLVAAVVLALLAALRGHVSLPVRVACPAQ